MDKRTRAQLERLFAAEIHGRDIQLPKATAARLERLGFIHRVQRSNKDRLGTFTWETHALTHAGRYAYHQTCKDKPEPL